MKNSIFKNKTFYFMLTLCLIVLAGAIYVAKDYGTKKNSTKKDVNVYKEVKGKTNSEISKKVTPKDKTNINKSKKNVASKELKNQNKTNKSTPKQTSSILKNNKVNANTKINTQNSVKSNSTSVMKNNNTSISQQNTKVNNQKTSSIQKNSTVAKSVLQEQGEACMAEPVDGTLLTPYTYRNGVWSKTLGSLEVHKAIDIKGKIGEPVKASDAGMVINVFNDNKLGETVIIKHSNDLRTQYSNLDKNLNVKIGSPVSKGTVIGKIGNTARFECKDEPHLHYAVLKGQNYVDPINYFAETSVAAKYQAKSQDKSVVSNKIVSKTKKDLSSSNIKKDIKKKITKKNNPIKKENNKNLSKENKKYKIITDPNIIGD
jgi:murein DD-endopeptidase MepM/ murein hydrolase activator NlpD